MAYCYYCCSSSKIMSSIVCCLAVMGGIAVLTEARDHLIGGKADAWKVPPPSDSDFLNKWASKSRFQIGDNLVWKYDSKKDSVVEVREEAYKTCNTSNPIAELKNDDTRVELKKAGPHYFISGIKDNCDKGEKLTVVVITPRTAKPPSSSPAFSPTPAPHSGAAETPAVAPTSAAAPAAAAAAAGALGLLASSFLLI